MEQPTRFVSRRSPAAQSQPRREVTLSHTEELLLVSLRLWTATHVHHPQRDWPDWSTPLHCAGLDRAARQLFDPLLGVLFAGGERELAVHDVHCRGLSADEGRFLALVALAQRWDEAGVELLLMSWLPPMAIRVAGSLATRLAMALAGVGLQLPERRLDLLMASPLPATSMTLQ